MRLSDIDLGDKTVELPDRIGPFAIHGRLGRGGMGVVLDASRDGRRVALKLIRPKGDPDRRRTLIARLLREARILQQLRHPGIVALVDAGEVEGMAYLAMEQLEGVTLHQVRRRTSLDRPALISLGTQLAHALAHMHEAGVIHRDIKPGNVIIQPGGRAVLADFGIARHSEATGITRAGEVVGSAGYLAPECFLGQAPSELSDQYALGVLLFELGAHTRRRKLPKNAPVLERFLKLREVEWHRFPDHAEMQDVRDLLERMLAEHPEERFADARACFAAWARLEVEQTELDLSPPRPASRADSETGPSTLQLLIDELRLHPHSPWDGDDDDGPMEGRPEILELPEEPTPFEDDALTVRGDEAEIASALQGRSDLPRRLEFEDQTELAGEARTQLAALSENQLLDPSEATNPILATLEDHPSVKISEVTFGEDPTANTQPQIQDSEFSDTQGDLTELEGHVSPEMRPPSAFEPITHRPPSPRGSLPPSTEVVRTRRRPRAGEEPTEPPDKPTPPPPSRASLLPPPPGEPAALTPAPAPVATPKPAPAPKRRSAVTWALGAAGLALGLGASTLIPSPSGSGSARLHLPLPPPGDGAPAFVYEGEGPPSDNNVKVAVRLQSQAARALKERELDKATQFLAMCIRLADLADCHLTLGTLLSIEGRPAAGAHLRRYLELAPSGRDAPRVRAALGEGGG